LLGRPSVPDDQAEGGGDGGTDCCREGAGKAAGPDAGELGWATGLEVRGATRIGLDSVLELAAVAGAPRTFHVRKASTVPEAPSTSSAEEPRINRPQRAKDNARTLSPRLSSENFRTREGAPAGGSSGGGKRDLPGFPPRS
jgi:hypothetical protein